MSLLMRNIYWLILPLVLLVACLYVNHGQFIYALDDAYIHLALADNISHGHYGLEKTRAGSPSSSALWPVFLSLFMGFSWADYVPFVINLALYVLTANLLYGALLPVYPRRAASVTLLILLLSNSIGVIFTGMENMIQITCAIGVMTALLRSQQGLPLPRMLWVWLLLGPLMRYETSAICGGAALLLAWRGHWRYLIPVSLAAAGLLAFSYFLWQTTGYPLPSSVVDKLRSPHAFPNIIIMIMLIVSLGMWHTAQPESRKRLELYGLILICAIAQTMLGRLGFFDRYEAYIVAVMLLLFAHDAPAAWPTLKKSGDKQVAIAATVLLCAAQYGFTSLSAPAASHSIFLQHVQMRRLLDIAGNPTVAVNDIGYITHRNPSRALDIWGLDSIEMNRMRSTFDPRWLLTVEEQHIPWVMIYPSWFSEFNIPESWKRVGTLLTTNELDPLRPSAARNRVGIFITDPKEEKRLRAAIGEWSKDLPADAIWTWWEDEDPALKQKEFDDHQAQVERQARRAAQGQGQP